MHYHSGHHHGHIIGTAVGMIKTALRVSSPDFFHENKIRVEKILLENGYPDTVITTLLNEHYTFMRQKEPLEKRTFVGLTFTQQTNNCKKTLIEMGINSQMAGAQTAWQKLEQHKQRTQRIKKKNSKSTK